MNLPASLCSLLWRTAVLPQALYGSELRDVQSGQLASLSRAGRDAISKKAPLHLNAWRSPELLGGLPLGDTAVREPLLEVRERQLRWLQLLANLPGIVGIVHRVVACPAATWDEPSAALRAAVKSLGWQVRRNVSCLRAAAWPLLEPELSYPGAIDVVPVDSFPAPGAVFTDGSLLTAGGAAVWIPDSEESVTASVPAARSSTQCELVALCLAVQLSPALILTDSLCSLQLLRRWGVWPTARVLACMDRIEVRQLLAMARACPSPPALEKVRAHDEAAIARGYPKAVGNDMADLWARRAAGEAGHPVWAAAVDRYGDPVELLDASGSVIMDVRVGLAAAWWHRSQSSRSSRPRLAMLFPADMNVDWAASTGVFRRPTCTSSSFVHPVPQAVVKWVARIRCGCLATRDRLHRHQLGVSAGCACCGAAIEDDTHVLAGCPATGTADWEAIISEAWQAAAVATRLSVAPPAAPWLQQHRLPLLAALIPSSTLWHSPLPPGDAARFLHRLHLALAESTAERMRRREALHAAHQSAAISPPSAASGDTPLPTAGLRLPCPLPPERQLSVPSLRQLEVSYRSIMSGTAPPAPAPATAAPPPANAAPAQGEPRRLWLRERLVTVITTETVVCPAAAGATSEVLLELFERVTGEAATDSPGVALASRRRSFAKVLGNVARDFTFDPPLVHSVFSRGVMRWNRAPRIPADITSWRRRVEASEDAHPALRQRGQMAEADAGLAAWIRGHRHLRPVEVEKGEAGMALLILWEVDHGRSYPTRAAGGLADTLMGFTRRLKLRVRQDPELQQWLVCREMQMPLAPGLVETHHTRWSVQVVAPAAVAGRGWYDTFVARWRCYLATQMPSAVLALGETASSSSSSVSSAVPHVAQHTEDSESQPSRTPRPHTPPAVTGLPPAKRRRAIPARRVLAVETPPPDASTSQPAPPQRIPSSLGQGSQHPRPPVEEPPPKRRQTGIAQFLRPRVETAIVTEEPRLAKRLHGRAAEEPPT